MTDRRIRILIVDDSLVFRKILLDVLQDMTEVEVVGQAPNGRIALQKIPQLNPDLLLLDVEMPEMGGLELLEEMKARGLGTGVIMMSGSSPATGSKTMEALTAGAFEFFPKPERETIEETRSELEPVLRMAVQAFQERTAIRRVLAGQREPRAPTPAAPSPRPPSEPVGPPPPPKNPWLPSTRADLVIIGISTGGPPALLETFSRLSQPLGVPVLVVQHIPPQFSEALATRIREKSGVWVEEARHGQTLEAGKTYLAPGGFHMRLSRPPGRPGYVVHLTEDPPENGCRPSVDYLLRSVTQNFPGRVALVIMTGMGIDGLAGARLIRAAGGYVIAQNAETCTVYGMSRAVIEAGLANEVLSLEEIPAAMERLTGGIGPVRSPSGRFWAIPPAGGEKSG
ncbi:MAG: chemotaxis-specific protein-glutamate methyltransferase CheB [Candidatus Riflebacteria bacterium]|nr:chemotaxis-specific protein-glutamate methyltransferase CheB [Candidatus Riflebacteria bacterium]